MLRGGRAPGDLFRFYYVCRGSNDALSEDLKSGARMRFWVRCSLNRGNTIWMQTTQYVLTALPVNFLSFHSFFVFDFIWMSFCGSFRVALQGADMVLRTGSLTLLSWTPHLLRLLFFFHHKFITESAGGLRHERANGQRAQTAALHHGKGGQRVWVPLARREGEERPIYPQSGAGVPGGSVGNARRGQGGRGERSQRGERDAPPGECISTRGHSYWWLSLMLQDGPSLSAEDASTGHAGRLRQSGQSGTHYSNFCIVFRKQRARWLNTFLLSLKKKTFHR